MNEWIKGQANKLIATNNPPKNNQAKCIYICMCMCINEWMNEWINIFIFGCVYIHITKLIF